MIIKGVPIRERFLTACVEWMQTGVMFHFTKLAGYAKSLGAYAPKELAKRLVEKHYKAGDLAHCPHNTYRWMSVQERAQVETLVSTLQNVAAQWIAEQVEPFRVVALYEHLKEAQCYPACEFLGFTVAERLVEVLAKANVLCRSHRDGLGYLYYKPGPALLAA